MIDVFALCWRNREMASTRYRVLYLKSPLQNRGVRYTVGKRCRLWGKSVPRVTRNLFYASTCDIFLIQKDTLLMPHMDILLKINKNVVLDIDDAIYEQPPWKERDVQASRKKWRHMFQRVPHAIVGSRAIKDFASQFCKNVLVAPTALPKERYEKHSEPRQSDKDGPFVVGWIGHPDNLWYLKQIESQLREFLAQRNDAVLRIVTASNPRLMPLAARIGDDVDYVEWNEETEIKLLENFDVTIRPLTNDEWTRSKGGFTSVVQSMGTGTPVIVSPVGSLEETVEHGESGFHVVNPSNWGKYLNRLADNENERRRMGRKAFRRVGEARFWNDQRADDLASFYRSIV